MAHLCDPNTCVAKGDSGLETQLELCNRDLNLNNQIKSNKVFLNVCGVGGGASAGVTLETTSVELIFFPRPLGSWNGAQITRLTQQEPLHSQPFRSLTFFSLFLGLGLESNILTV